ncbi:hypothetical protein N0V90_007566 [Kalmusia sp. IMI 367209]|nr:hypothetical protein N0V90_007566 [Kalmusia sp. IMI 367209]
MSGLRLKINFKTETIEVLSGNKRALEEQATVSQANVSQVSGDEMEIALILAGMKSGGPSDNAVTATVSDGPASKKLKIKHSSEDESKATFANPGADANSAPARNSVTLVQSTMTRKARIVCPSNPADAALIASAAKAGTDIYDSDVEDLAGEIDSSTTHKPELFRNVKWGSAATITDSSPDEDFPTQPDFIQFVPGRWERLVDGTIYDQKNKLIVKLTSKDGKKMMFKNPPPKDWTDQKAITCLNKRVSQQIRRNTSVRFRPVVESYVYEERVWISAHLKDGKPPSGWKQFVAEFNLKFAGATLDGMTDPRPIRSHSSLTKEVERFGKEFYAKGKVPVTKEKKATKEKATKGKKKAE